MATAVWIFCKLGAVTGDLFQVLTEKNPWVVYVPLQYNKPVCSAKSILLICWKQSVKWII